MNTGQLISWAMVGFSLGASVGYAFAHDWRRATYFLFGACITATVICK